jgi:hypothetical protein
MKKIKLLPYLLLFSLLSTVAIHAIAQDEEKEEKKKPRPARKTFASAVLIDNQSDVINSRNTFEWNIQHRFGSVDKGSSNLWGIFAPANTRLGFNFVPVDRLRIGFGLSKINISNPFIDFNIKYKILQQTRKNEMPVNLVYFGNMAIDTQKPEKFEKGSHRLSYFHELIVSRRFSSKFSAQVAGMVSHFNSVDTLYDNDVFGVSLAAAYKVSSTSSIQIEWTEPLVQHRINNSEHGDFTKEAGPKRNIALSFETATSSHAFQIFISTYRDLLPQYNLAYNTNKFVIEDSEGNNKLGFMIGFNITRLWNF